MPSCIIAADVISDFLSVLVVTYHYHHLNFIFCTSISRALQSVSWWCFFPVAGTPCLRTTYLLWIALILVGVWGDKHELQQHRGFEAQCTVVVRTVHRCCLLFGMLVELWKDRQILFVDVVILPNQECEIIVTFSSRPSSPATSPTPPCSWRLCGYQPPSPRIEANIASISLALSHTLPPVWKVWEAK